MQPVDGLGRGVRRRQARLHVVLGQQSDGFGVGLRLRHDAMGLKLGADLAKVFDDPVMDDGNRAGFVRMGVVLGRRSMRGPAGVADPCLPGERVVYQQVRQVDELANCPAPIKAAVVDGRDTSTVIAAIFEPFQSLDKDRRDFVIAQYPNDSAHLSGLCSVFSFWTSGSREALWPSPACRSGGHGPGRGHRLRRPM